MRYRLQREQQLNCDLQTAWDFFSSPANLAKITPADMGFTVLSEYKAGEEIYEGMIIDYTVSPILKFPLKWKTRISQVNKGISFTDFQEKGPYAYWNHFHEFEANAQGVLMRDTVDYELPFGILGQLAHRLFVRHKLEHIFNYRQKTLKNYF